MQLLSHILLMLYAVTLVGVIVVIITENRNPLKTLPWIIVLVLAPVVGLLFYFFFGQNLSKQRIITRRMRRRMTMHLERNTPRGFEGIADEHLPVAHLLAETALASPLHGNDIKPYTSGREKFEALLGDIAAAQHHIHLQYYIIDDDDTGRRLRDALIERARNGVEVRVLYDDVGSTSTPKRFFEEMRRAGIEVRSFLHVKFPRFTSKVNYRNHRKIVVIDGCVGYIGGMNIADRYLRGTSWGTWRDTHFRIVGHGVEGLQASFLGDWSATTQQELPELPYYRSCDTAAADGGAVMQVLASGPLGKWRTLLQAESYAISKAHDRIWVQTPYYLPSEVINSALQVAALAGLDVRLMLPARSDSRIIDLASHSYLDDMMQAGVKIYCYRPGFLHSKLLVIDASLTLIGSANMDFRSFEHNFEVTAFVYDRDFNARMSAIFERDGVDCRSVVPSEWFRRPRLTKFAESVVRIFSPLM